MIHKYRVLKSSWGIAIDIDLDVVSLEEIEMSKVEEINPRVCFLILDSSFDNGLRPFIKDGITDISEFIYSKIGTQAICLLINKIEYNPTDFQKEGLYYAVQDSIYAYFGETPLPHKIEFDKVANKYVFADLAKQ